jgi:two-component system, OmpR family, response regulator RegX3
VRAWLRCTQIMPTAVVDALQINGFRLDPERRRLATPTGSYKLTTLEARLLYILMSHPGKTIDSGTLIERTWGCFSGGDKVVLKNVIYRLRRKLETDPRQPSHLLTEDNGYKFLA